MYNAINRGDLRAVKFGGTLLVPRCELERLLGVGPSHGPVALRDALRDLARFLDP